MNRSLLMLLLLFFVMATVHAQVPKKRLPQNINMPTYSHIFPSLSGDGNQMIFLTNYTNSEGFETKYTFKTGMETWEDPEPIPSINRPGLDHIGSFCLSYDGNFVVFASRRSPSIGNYDIWISEKIGKNWSTPQNPGKPLNSPGNEGNPSLSPDGKSIYFMRCESMDNTNKNHCQLYVSNRISATRWSEPEALPDEINASHETTPRIMADNNTLIFASGRNGGKGMLDLYMTSRENNIWTKPINLSYINTDQNDEYVSVPARGDLIYFTGTYRDNFNIFKAIIPEEYRPKKVLMLTGTVSYMDGQKPSDDVIIQAFDVTTGEVFTTTKLKQDDNSYTIFLPEGTAYDVSAFPQKGNHGFYGQIIDLKSMPISRKEDMSMTLETIKPGVSIPLYTIRFEPYSANLLPDSEIAIKRIIGFMKKNPNIKVEIAAYIDQIFKDTIPSNDLTEMIVDTVFIEIPNDEISIRHDIEAEEFTLENEDSITNAEEESFDIKLDGDDSDEFETFKSISPRDSVLNLGYTSLEGSNNFETYFKIKYTYHNDRTQQMAETLMNKLIQMGVPPKLLVAKGYGDNWLKDLASEERNYWLEIKVLGN